MANGSRANMSSGANRVAGAARIKQNARPMAARPRAFYPRFRPATQRAVELELERR